MEPYHVVSQTTKPGSPATLNIDERLVQRARQAAVTITGDIQHFIEQHTTTSSERTVCRLLGIDGVDDDGIPFANRVVEALQQAQVLDVGAAYWVAGGALAQRCQPQELAQRISTGKLAVDQWIEGVMELPRREVLRHSDQLTAQALARIDRVTRRRDDLKTALQQGQTPLLYVIVATGNIHEDVLQARAAARQGADIIAVIRSTAQSLLDYVPYGPTSEGFGGTFATQENFRIMRAALDQVSRELGRYIHLVNYASGLCMPEIAALAAMEGLDYLLSDAMYGILFRDINPERTFVDQFFSRVVSTYAGIVINTGEDNYLTTADAVNEVHTVLASQFINEAFARQAGMPSCLMGLGHAFQKTPELEDGFLLELADAQLVRQLFPEAPLKFMPPTKYMTGNVFRGHLIDAMFNLASVMTGQNIHLVGILTEAIHTPYLHDRMLSIENARYVMNNARHLTREIRYVPGGLIERRANEVLVRAVELLENVQRVGLWEAIAQGVFANVRRSRSGGKGRQGMVARRNDYHNPFLGQMLAANRARFKAGERRE